MYISLINYILNLNNNKMNVNNVHTNGAIELTLKESELQKGFQRSDSGNSIASREKSKFFKEWEDIK